jgi:hypothetical protein
VEVRVIVRLPNGEKASVPQAKLSGYLLSETHPVGKSKARLLRSLGFHDNNLEALASELLSLAKKGEVVVAEPSLYGIKYVVEGMINTPSGRTVRLRSVWLLEKNSIAPRLITAYPAPELIEGE